MSTTSMPGMLSEFNSLGPKAVLVTSPLLQTHWPHCSFAGYWLLLRGGIVQSVLWTTATFWSTSIVCPRLSSNHSWFIHQSSLTNTAETPSSEWSRQKLSPLILPAKYLCHTPQGSFTCRKILRHEVDGFTFVLKEVVLRIVITLKNPSSSAGLEPANLGSNGKHDNH
jgi:hypothetical protein